MYRRGSQRPGSKPEFQRQIVPVFAGRQIRTKLFVIAIPQDFAFQVFGAREVLHVVAITFIIPLKLGEGDIVSLQPLVVRATL
jgi:hypothetical protein